MVDQYAAHRLCGDGEEVTPVGPFDASLIYQPQIGLVHHRGRRKRVAGGFEAEMVVRHLGQMVVDQGHQPLERVGFATPQSHQGIGDRVLRCSRFHGPPEHWTGYVLPSRLEPLEMSESAPPLRVWLRLVRVRRKSYGFTGHSVSPDGNSLPTDDPCPI